MGPFSIFVSGQTENMQYAYFQFDPFPKLKIDSESIFQMEMSILLFFFKKMERFGQYLKKSKNRFSIVFPKSEIDLVNRNIHIQISTMEYLGFLFFPFMHGVYYCKGR